MTQASNHPHTLQAPTRLKDPWAATDASLLWVLRMLLR